MSVIEVSLELLPFLVGKYRVVREFEQDRLCQ